MLLTGAFFRVAVRTSGATDISIYNSNPIIQCPRNGTFLTGTKNKKNFIKANHWSNWLSKEKAPSKLSSKLSSALASNSAKNKHKSIVFKHIQWICVFSEKRHHYLLIVLCDLLIIYERIRHHLHLLRRRTLKQTQYFVFIHI